ncbi:ArsR/SmtB family transcription factor [Streptomyces sp. NPDC089424]|uniref:ArsR/SmtB family transcription factor n=1 Tax=Streptomyces sp. NPDC089424 TaxID=3365917 RepID=UPI00382A008B
MARPRAAARTIGHPDISEVALQQVLEALGDPVRRMLVSQLTRSDGDMACGAFEAPVSTSTLTHHFNVLRESGVIRQYYVGTAKMNTLRTDELEERFPGVLSSVVAAALAEAGTVRPAILR